jgi:hypothetical protein
MAYIRRLPSEKWQATVRARTAVRAAGDASHGRVLACARRGAAL